MTPKLKPHTRRAQLLDAALNLSALKGYNRITVSDVAAACGVTAPLINHYFSTMGQLQRAVMREAIQRELLTIIAQGLANRDDQALKAPEVLRQAACNALAS